MTLPRRPALHAEEVLLARLLDGHYPPGTALPAERELAAELGVTRPTLREALQRLARDGLLDIRQGKSTLARDPREGGLTVLAHLAARGGLNGLIPDLLDLRAALLPHWTTAAVACPAAAAELADLLAEVPREREDDAAVWASFDWRVQSAVARLSGNALAPMLLGSFRGVFAAAGAVYFASPERRARSRRYYAELREAARRGDADEAAHLAREVAADSLRLWQQAQEGEKAPRV
ncbi:GntR family transcriptional regulator [Deinococcus metallilatus]|uniref:GntR family negative regulator for fad regulon and positive regulator of fabA n=1 Tax=Deinococcus metallilatus TaxID=1211322 RepID=A0AAJ5JZC4_9DEIO|nr:GntR family transcriptional regulator [Deinococcus metallilatus]MBB5296585.1 GntR family negative regulator for fad regulon and positive regulator of fabA [Deinococcus metallilatus]QBY08392.1 GntR family transcriptional regulator [Deinococcus metallilatus]RXJ11191.1 GntR family transcriptional regulator [Deinococcus metallilatus]TLK24682.1 GntR family transcriptional regulator [Deinococcus metallilatus]GMA17502.1 fatty acid metabolism regulator protein [Deinococcus metallilatus]